MRLVRLATCAALAGSLLVVGTSHAAAKPVCNIVNDVKGDADVANGIGQDDALDILSADVATNKKSLTAAIRVVKASPKSAYYQYGVTWRLNFTVADVPLSISAVSDRNGVIGQYTYTDTTGGHIIASDAVVAIDTTANEVRISVPISAYGDHADLKPGTKISAISATTGAIANTPAGNLRFPTIDSSDTKDGAYTAGAKSCVTPGK